MNKSDRLQYIKNRFAKLNGDTDRRFDSVSTEELQEELDKLAAARKTSFERQLTSDEN